MKYAVWLASLLVLAGCASQPKDDRVWMALKCSGGSSSWNDCYRLARERCPSGFDMANKVEDRVGLKREVEVACKR